MSSFMHQSNSSLAAFGGPHNSSIADSGTFGQPPIGPSPPFVAAVASAPPAAQPQPGSQSNRDYQLPAAVADPLHVIMQREQAQYLTTLQQIPSFRETHNPPPPQYRQKQFVARNAWSTLDNSKTNHACLALCLGNVGWEEGSRDDGVRPGLPRVYSWRQPKSLAETPLKAVERIGAALESQYDKLRKGIVVRQCLNPTLDELKDVIHKQRRNAGTDKVLLHYCGHSCWHRDRENATIPLPRPERNYFFVLSNKGTPAPFTIDDLLQLIGFPHILVFDCASAGSVLNYLSELMRKEELAQTQRLRASPSGTDLSAASAIRGDSFFLGACAAGEALPSHPLLPNDVFSACLTTPIQTSILWFIIQHQQFADLHPVLMHCVPGMLDDRRTPLGELKSIFVAITDCIAWASVSQELFFRLFRQDLFIVALFRGFLLADRIGVNLGCTPQSFPRIPSTAAHPLWETWDCVLDNALSAVMRHMKPKPTAGLSLIELRTAIDVGAVPRAVLAEIAGIPPTGIEPSSFFRDELKSFHAMLYELERDPTAAPHIPRLAIVLHAVCLLASRRDAMFVLARLVDRGAWAVDQCEQVRMYNEALNRLWTNTVVELREFMVFIFCKSVFVDPLLIPLDKRSEAVPYLARIVREPTNAGRLGIFSSAPCQQLLALTTLLLLGHNSVATLELCIRENLLNTCAELVESLCNIAADNAPKSMAEEHHYTQLKVAVCAMITLLMYSGQAAVATVSQFVSHPLSLLLADPSALVRRAVIRVFHTLVAAPSLRRDRRDLVVRLVMAHARIEGNVAARIEIVTLLFRAAVRSADVLHTIPAQDLRRVLTPTLNANRRETSGAGGGTGGAGGPSDFSPVSLPPAVFNSTSSLGAQQSQQTHHHAQSSISGGGGGGAVGGDDDDGHSDGSPTALFSPHMSPYGYGSLLTPHSASNPWLRHRLNLSGVGGAQPAAATGAGEASTGAMEMSLDLTLAVGSSPPCNSIGPAGGLHSPVAAVTLGPPPIPENPATLTMAIIHTLSVFSVDLHLRVRAFGCKAIAELAHLGNIPFTVQTQRRETFTPKQSHIDRVFSLFRPKNAPTATTGGGGAGNAAAGGMKGGAGGGRTGHVHAAQNHPNSLSEADLALSHLDIEEYDVTLKEIALEDIATANDVVYEAVAFAGKPLLVASAESDPRNPINKRFRSSVDSYIRSVSSQLNATLAPNALSAGFVPKAAADTEAKLLLFHPTEPHLLSTSASDRVSVWRFEDKEKDLKLINAFDLAALMNRWGGGGDLGGGGGGAGSSMGPSSSSAPLTPKTPTSSSSRALHFANTNVNVNPATALKCQVSSLAIVDAVHHPLLAVVTVDGSVTLLANYTLPGHTYVVTTFGTMVHEHAVHSHHCALTYQPIVQHVHVSGWMGYVSTWDLATELMVSERRESHTAATCLTVHHQDPACFAGGFTSGHVLLFDTRTQRSTVSKLDGLRGSCLGITFAKTNPHILSAASTSGIVTTWDERRLSSSGKGCHLDTFTLVQNSSRARKSTGLGMENLTAVDLHPCGGIKPITISGTPSRLRVCSGASSIKKFPIKAQVQSCAWHPNRLMAAYSVGGKLTLLDQPIISDASVATDVFDF